MHAQYTPNDAPTKHCPGCDQNKPTYEFHRNKRQPDGLHRLCKQCRAEREGFRYRPGVADGYRRCSHCHRELPATAEFFYRDNRFPGMLAAQCKTCVAERATAWNTDNRDRHQDSNRKYRSAHLDEIRARGRAFYHDHKDAYRAYYRRNYAAHLERGRRWYHANLEHARELAISRSRKWRSADPVRSRLIVQASRVRPLGLPHQLTVADWHRAVAFFDGKCAVCGRAEALTIDHWVPISDLQCPGTVPTNIVPLCGGQDSCNSSKADKQPREWLIRKYGEPEATQILARIEAYFASLIP